MKIALVFPKSIFLTNPLTWPPLGLFYIAAQLEAQGHETDFFDLSMRNLPKDGEFDQLWLSANSAQMWEARKISEITKKFSHTTTVFGGSAVWADPLSSMGLFHVHVVGEGDHPNSIKRIIEFANDRERKTTYHPELSRDLDWVLPPIRRWSLDYHAYMTDQDGEKYRMASLFTTRGCPFSCSFCESGRHGVIWDNLTRYEPLWSVEADIDRCKGLGFTGLAYYDDVFILNKRRALQLAELNVKYGMKSRGFIRSDLAVRHGFHFLEHLRDSGLIEVFVGVESADDRIKKNIYKGTTADMDAEVLRWCKELGIRCKMSFILGLPGESLESMETTRRWILEHRPDIVQMDRLIPFPGTPLTKHPEKYDLKYNETIDEEWFFRGSEGSGKSFVSTSHLSAERIDDYLYDLEQELLDEGLSSYDH